MSQSIIPLRIASAERKVRHVFVRDLVVEAQVGIYRHEKRRTQPIRINLDLTVSEPDSPAADEIEHVVCYEQVVNDTKDVIAGGHINLVETMAEKIAERILQTPATIAVRVRVEKLTVFPDAASVGVEIERTSH